MNYLVTYETKDKETMTVETITYEEAKKVYEHAKENEFVQCSIKALNNEARKEMLINDMIEMLIEEEIKKIKKEKLNKNMEKNMEV